MLNIGVLVSGRGSNLEAILKSVERGSVRGAAIKVVLSNDRAARALEVARRHGVEAVVVEDQGASRESFDAQLAIELEKHGVGPGTGLVLLAGYMKILSRAFVALYPGRIMNIHPSLLPAFPGVDAQRQAFEYGTKVAGCTVHFVVPEVDAGPIIIQKAVAVEEDDDEESLSSRILKQEHRIYPQAVKLFAEGRLKINGRKVTILP